MVGALLFKPGSAVMETIESLPDGAAARRFFEESMPPLVNPEGFEPPASTQICSVTARMARMRAQHVRDSEPRALWANACFYPASPLPRASGRRRAS